MLILITLSTILPVRTRSATVLCETTAYGIFISLAAYIYSLSRYKRKSEKLNILQLSFRM
jgi:hypothetical protein